MKVFILLLSFLCFNSISAQKNLVTVGGTIRTAGDTDAVMNATVVLSINDSLGFFQTTGKNGQYEFTLQTFHGTCSITVLANFDTRSTKNKSARYISNGDMRVIQMNVTKKYIADFNLSGNACYLMRTPEVYFKENSIEFETDTLITKENSLHAFEDFLSLAKENPGTVLKITGHCAGNEKNKLNLSLNRANSMRDRLVASGIEKERLVCVGASDKFMLISDKQLKKAKIKTEREQLTVRNRRVGISIERFDYKSDKKTTITSDESED